MEADRHKIETFLMQLTYTFGLNFVFSFYAPFRIDFVRLLGEAWLRTALL